MEIRFYNSKSEYVLIQFGFQSPVHSSMYWIGIVKVYLDENEEVCFAKSLFSGIKHWRFWFK